MDPDADEHEAATATLVDLHAREELLTHNYVLVELTALVQARLGLRRLRDLVERLIPVARMAWVNAEIHHAAANALLAAGRRRVSFVDWVSFEVMRGQGIETAFAFDPDFRAQGFRTIP